MSSPEPETYSFDFHKETAEILALSAWSRLELGAAEVAVEARGKITSIALLLSAALDGAENGHAPLLDRVLVDGFPSSLKDLLLNGATYDAAAPLFCPGLLEAADVLEFFSLARPGVVQK